MKKIYIAPEAEIEKFTIVDVITISGGINDGGDETEVSDDFYTTEERRFCLRSFLYKVGEGFRTLPFIISYFLFYLI